MSALWTGEELVTAMGARPLGNLPAGINGVSIDTRSLTPGDAFFAIKGDTKDGHEFITAAVKAGAGMLVVAEGRLAGLGRLSTPLAVVPDVLAAMERAGIGARARFEGKVVAVTGSVGKTTTKEALRHVLASVGEVHASDKSFNNHWGVPLTLARLPRQARFGVFEIGMNHPGEIRPLVKMVRPHVAIVTLVAAAHLGHFSSLEEIAQAKAEIFEGIEPGGYALVNRDDPRWALQVELAKKAGVANVQSFGEHAGAEYRLLGCALHADHSVITARIGTREIEARIGAPGRHIVQNALAVLGAAHLIGADLGKVAAALGTLSAGGGRGARHLLGAGDGDFTLIDESYNANPASMKAAIDLLAANPVGASGRRIAVLGDMLELGEYAPELHAGLSEHLVPGKVDLVLMAGPQMKNLADALDKSIERQYRADAASLGALLTETVRPGDVVMVKSSKGIGFSKIVDTLIARFPPKGLTGTAA